MPEELRKGMTFVPVERIEQVWQAAMGLRLDSKAVELAEARELLDEASDLISRARGKAAAVKRQVAEDGAREHDAAPNGRVAGRNGVGKAPKPAAPKRTPARSGEAKKTTAARGRSGRKR